MVLKKVREQPLVVLIDLPEGCTPGRWESAVAFGECFAELKNQYPDKKFQLLPFQYQTYENGTEPTLVSILAVEM